MREKLKKITMFLGQGSWPPIRDSNTELPVYEAGVTNGTMLCRLYVYIND
jgi:hypothetical protein